MPFSSRLLIGLNGYERDVHLIRYAHMVARLRDEDDDSEIRFVYLLPRRSSANVPRRAILREHMQTHFPKLSDAAPIGCDVLKGHTLDRLSTVAADFESNMLLVGDASWPRAKCARLALEAPCSVWLVPPNWAPVLRRVLVPIDFSERSARCLQAAIDLVRPFPRAKCLALHVYRHDTRFVDGDLEGVRRRALFEDYFAFMAGIETDDVLVEPVFAQSHSVEREIDRAAHRYGVDLVVMSTRGRTRAASLIHPSGVERAIRQCHAPLLVLKSSDPPLGLGGALRERLSEPDGLQFS